MAAATVLRGRDGWELVPLTDLDASALRALDATPCYVLDAAALDAITAAQRAYVEALEAAPFWRDAEDGR